MTRKEGFIQFCWSIYLLTVMQIKTNAQLPSNTDRSLNTSTTLIGTLQTEQNANTPIVKLATHLPPVSAPTTKNVSTMSTSTQIIKKRVFLSNTFQESNNSSTRLGTTTQSLTVHSGTAVGTTTPTNAFLQAILTPLVKAKNSTMTSVLDAVLDDNRTGIATVMNGSDVIQMRMGLLMANGIAIYLFLANTYIC